MSEDKPNLPRPETLDDLAHMLATHLPGWWWRIGLCHVSGDCSIGPDYNDPVHRDRLMREFPMDTFDAGFHCDMRPGDGVEAIIDAVMNCLDQVAAAMAANHISE